MAARTRAIVDRAVAGISRSAPAGRVRTRHNDIAFTITYTGRITLDARDEADASGQVNTRTAATSMSTPTVCPRGNRIGTATLDID